MVRLQLWRSVAVAIPKRTNVLQFVREHVLVCAIALALTDSVPLVAPVLSQPLVPEFCMALQQTGWTSSDKRQRFGLNWSDVHTPIAVFVEHACFVAQWWPCQATCHRSVFFLKAMCCIARAPMRCLAGFCLLPRPKNVRWWKRSSDWNRRFVKQKSSALFFKRILESCLWPLQAVCELKPGHQVRSLVRTRRVTRSSDVYQVASILQVWVFSLFQRSLCLVTCCRLVRDSSVSGPLIDGKIGIRRTLGS